ncbi:ferritin-like domain-containing protein [Kitasatospora brasiliensis]|uniref:ferritin-like domain-containing protein n=1 Tax=Kitasatospora brasiliensis TaxID=3058040 RepID=UPI00292E68E9|nr:ferritin-like domain-containing protein [Kitasatospora sp. K002]
MQPPSRRTLLALGLLTTLTACTGGSPGHVPAPAPDPDTPARLRAIAATDRLLGGYERLLAAPDAQGALLRPLRDETARHRAALLQGLPTAGPSPTGTPTEAVPTTAGLAALERRAAESHLADLAEVGPDLARLLASIAAARALHAAALGDPTPVTTPDDRDPTTPAATAAAVPALQGVLGAEHAAVYGYGVVGARLADERQRADARADHAAHQARRDAWQRLLAAATATPTPAAGGYRLPFPVTSPADAGRLAVHLETRLTTVYADLVATAPAPYRPQAATALRESAVRALRWGAPATAFPGLPG